jgi:hypothetical protein
VHCKDRDVVAVIGVPRDWSTRNALQSAISARRIAAAEGVHGLSALHRSR